MPNKAQIALQLRNFVAAAEKESRTPGRINPPAKRFLSGSADKDAILQVYETYLNKLTNEERAELDRIVKKMSGAV